MLHAVERNIILIIGIAVCCGVGVMVAPYLVSSRGDAGPTILGAESPRLAMLAIAVGFVVMAIIAGVLGRLLNTAVGLFAAGVGLFVLDGRLESVRALAFANEGVNPTKPLTTLAIETVMLAVFALVSTSIAFAIGGKLKDIQPSAENQVPHPFFSVAALQCAVSGVITLIAVFFISQSPMKGQMVGATFVGGMLAGLVGRLISPHVQPMLLFASPILFGAIGCIIAIVMLKTPMDVAYVTGKLPAFSLAMPLDYAAGTFMGVAVGLGWARSFLHHEEAAEPEPATA